jgi:hypothetical protein
MSVNSLKQLSKVGAAACAAMLLLSGCDKGRETAADAAPVKDPPTTTAEEVPVRGKSAEVAPAPAPGNTGDVDLIGDKPAPGTAAKPDTKALLDDLKPDGPLSPAARRCYFLVGEMKTNIEKVSSDLDNGGKEVQRLIRTSDLLSKNITDLAELWPNDQFFRDACINTKRQVLVLNDELSRVPRKWTHVRWAFNGSLQEVSKLRLRAKDMAESEPKPVALVGKDGKPVVDKEGNQVYVVDQADAPVDLSAEKRDKAKREVEAARAQDRQRDEQKNKKKMPIDLEGAK